jgi:hypothetical protein
MNTKKLTQYAKQNPLATGIVGIVAVYATRKIFMSIFRGESIPERQPIPPIPASEKKYSYSSEQYTEWADALQQAFDGAFTDNDRVAKIMSFQKTKGDVFALVNAYGRRVIATPYFIDSDAMTLAQTLTYEMTTKDIDKYVNIPLSRTGFKF